MGTPIEKAITMLNILKILILIIPLYTSISSAETTSIMKLAPVEMESEALSKLCFEHLTQDILYEGGGEILIAEGVLRYLSNGSCLLMQYQPMEVRETKVSRLNGTQTNSLYSAISKCWVVDVSTPSAHVKLKVGVKFTSEGKVKAGEIHLLEHDANSQDDADVAFRAILRAILRCQKGGYQQAKADNPDTVTEAILEIDPNKMR